jgi:hypothetical protein
LPLPQENLAADPAVEQVDETNYPGAPESREVIEVKESSPQNPADKTEAPAKPDWRIEKYGENWEESAQYWKDTSAYWREETKKRQNRTVDRIEQTEKPAAAASPAAGDQPDGEVDLDSITSVKELITHMRGEVEKTFDEKLSARQVQDRFASSMRAAREEYVGDPAAGIPSFTDLEQDVLIPLCQKQPQILQLIKAMDDPKAAAYTLGMMLKLQGGFMDVLRGQGRAELTDKINSVTKQAIRVNKTGGGGKKSSKQTAADVWNMSSADFQKESAKVINGRE